MQAAKVPVKDWHGAEPDSGCIFWIRSGLGFKNLSTNRISELKSSDLERMRSQIFVTTPISDTNIPSIVDSTT